MKKRMIFTGLLIIVGCLTASVVLEVGNNIVVETSSGVYVEVDSTLIETGTGYFKGKITSGSQTGITEFAGLSLSTGIDGSITRYTGAAYGKGNGEGTNFKRYYEVNNTGSAVHAHVEAGYVGSGGNNETNSLSSDYYVYRFGSAWSGYGAGSGSSPIDGCETCIPSGVTDWVLSNHDFKTYTDTETAATGTPLNFNESGDGRQVDMTFSSLTGSGDVTVNQADHAPETAPNCNKSGYQLDLSADGGISGFSADITFHYTNDDVNGITESTDYLGIAKYNTSTNTWTWLGGTVAAGSNTVTVSGVTSFSTFALYRRIFSDITGDGYVDAADLQRLGDCWHETCAGEFEVGCDARFFNFNKNTDGGDQIIDAADLQVFGDCWHNGTP